MSVNTRLPRGLAPLMRPRARAEGLNFLRGPVTAPPQSAILSAMNRIGVFCAAALAAGSGFSVVPVAIAAQPAPEKQAQGNTTVSRASRLVS